MKIGMKWAGPSVVVLFAIVQLCVNLAWCSPQGATGNDLGATSRASNVTFKSFYLGMTYREFADTKYPSDGSGRTILVKEDDGGIENATLQEKNKYFICSCYKRWVRRSGNHCFPKIDIVPVSYGGGQAYPVFDFVWNGKDHLLQRITVDVIAEYENLKAAMIQKYGLPRSVTPMKARQIKGSSYANEEVSWETSSCSIVMEKLASIPAGTHPDDQYLATTIVFEHKKLTNLAQAIRDKYHHRIEQEQRKRAANDL